LGRATRDTERLARAFQYAATLHARQFRKGTFIPYISHLMAVASIVLEHGGNEDQVIAALLHDAIEDQPRGGLTRQRIRKEFGTRVLKLVEACSDSDGNRKPSWRKRKERYLKHLPKAPHKAKLVSLADKVHNARAILADHRRIGEKVWKRFNARKAAILWYYRSLADTFSRIRHHRPLAAELERVVSEMERLARRN
jgi:(p)ppGpp synthase/HD superfamily hydrolase